MLFPKESLIYWKKKGFAYLKKTQSALQPGLKYEAVTLTILLESSLRQVQYLPAEFPGCPEKLMPGPMVTSTDFSYKRLNQRLLNYDP